MAISLNTQLANGDLLFKLSPFPSAQFTQLHIDIINASPTALAFYEGAARNNVPVTIRVGNPDGTGGGTSYDPKPAADRTAPNGTIVIDARDFTSQTNPAASPAVNAVANAVNVALRGLHEAAHALDHLDGTPLANTSTFSTPSAYAVARSGSEGNSLAVEGKADTELQGKTFTPPGQTESVTINRDSYIAGDRSTDARLHTIYGDSGLTAGQQIQSAKDFGTLVYMDFLQSTSRSVYLTRL